MYAILVPTSHLLRQVLQNPEVSGRLNKWVIELGEFDIKFMLRTAIKRQAVVDFVVEFICSTKALGMTTDALSTSEGRTKDDEPTNTSNVYILTRVAWASS